MQNIWQHKNIWYVPPGFGRVHGDQDFMMTWSNITWYYLTSPLIPGFSVLIVTLRWKGFNVYLGLSSLDSFDNSLGSRQRPGRRTVQDEGLSHKRGIWLRQPTTCRSRSSGPAILTWLSMTRIATNSIHFVRMS